MQRQKYRKKMNASRATFKFLALKDPLKIMKRADSCKHRQAVKAIQCEKKFIQVSVTFF